MPAKTRLRHSPGTRSDSSGRALAVSAAFRAFVLDQLSELEDVLPRSMFGGVGLYSRGLFFGIIARDRLYLKVDDGNRRAYTDSGEQPFRPYPDRPGTMQYYAVPLNVLESAAELGEWARKAVAAAARGARPRSAARKR